MVYRALNCADDVCVIAVLSGKFGNTKWLRVCSSEMNESVVQDQSDHDASKELANPHWEKNPPVTLMYYDLTDLDPDHPKGIHPKSLHVIEQVC